MLSVFHSRINESMKTSHECLNRKSEGETEVGVHSSGKGKGVSAVGGTGEGDAGPDWSMVLVRSALEGSGLICCCSCCRLSSSDSPRFLHITSIIFCISGLLTSASSNILATRPKYIAGRRSSILRYNCRGSVSVTKSRTSSQTALMSVIGIMSSQSYAPVLEDPALPPPSTSGLGGGESIPDKVNFFFLRLILKGFTGTNGSSLACLWLLPMPEDHWCNIRNGDPGR